MVRRFRIGKKLPFFQFFFLDNVVEITPPPERKGIGDTLDTIIMQHWYGAGPTTTTTAVQVDYTVIITRSLTAMYCDSATY